MMEGTTRSGLSKLYYFYNEALDGQQPPAFPTLIYDLI